MCLRAGGFQLAHRSRHPVGSVLAAAAQSSSLINREHRDADIVTLTA